MALFVATRALDNGHDDHDGAHGDPHDGEQQREAGAGHVGMVAPRPAGFNPNSLGATLLT